MESEPGMLVFDERYLTVLQRLLVEHAAPSSSEEGLTGQQVAILLTSLLAIPGIVTSKAPEDPLQKDVEDDQLDDWTAFLVQGGAYYEKPDLGDAIARAHALYCDSPKSPRSLRILTPVRSRSGVAVTTASVFLSSSPLASLLPSSQRPWIRISG